MIRLSVMTGLSVLLLISIVLLFTGCAAGSATAVYSVKAGTADSVSDECRQSIIKDCLARVRR